MISAAQLGQRTVLAVEPQFRLTLLGIRTVTGETIRVVNPGAVFDVGRAVVMLLCE